MRVAAVALAVLLAPASGALADPPPAPIVDPAALPFAVTLPPGVTVAMSNGPDFTVYYFQKGEQTLGGAYVGYAPQFGADLQSPGAATGFSEQRVKCDHGHILSREIAIRFAQGSTEIVHAWTVEGPPQDADAATADAILATLHPPGRAPLTLYGPGKCPG